LDLDDAGPIENAFELILPRLGGSRLVVGVQRRDTGSVAGWIDATVGNLPIVLEPPYRRVVISIPIPAGTATGFPSTKMSRWAWTWFTPAAPG